jgi:protein-arginine deiminase
MSTRTTADIAPLVIEPISGGPTVPPGTRLELVTSPSGVLRIFEGTTAGSNELIGPTAGARHRFAALPTAPLRLGMEARRYAGRGFDGLVEITLRTIPPTGSPIEQRTSVRVSPWIMPNHTHAAEKVFVVDASASNSRFRTELRRLVTAAGCTLVEHAERGDIWMQDALEFGVSNLPGSGFRTVFRAPRNRPLKTFARTLLAPQLGFTRQGTDVPDTTFDSHGNLEASPAVTVNGKRYRFGRIYYGPGRPYEKLDEQVREFLHKQVVQAPFEIDTNWLTVGHVDEVVTFVPTNATSGNRFKLLIASPQKAYTILDGLARTNPTARMFVGRSLDGGATSLETDVRTFLGANEDIHPLMRDLIARGHVRHRVRTLRVFNDERQAKIDGIKATMMRELGLTAGDIIYVPAIFMPFPEAPTLTDALTPGMVNMLVVNRHCIVPKPFGPIVGGVDKFEEDVLASLRPLGLTVNFLDCWSEYHVNLGEIHCGTNTLRNPNHGRWWLFQP